MKILLIGTSDRKGGAAIASYRLFLSLKKRYKDIKMLVRDKLTSEEDIIGLNNTVSQKIFNSVRFIAERLMFFIYMKSKELLFFFSPANTGQNILNYKEVKEADIIHLHWINQAFISVNQLGKLFQSGKKVIWTMHDMWPFTGGCHYSGECTNYHNECGNCPFLRTNSHKDLSYKVFKKKEKIYKEAPRITFVSPSIWLAEKARKSSLLSKFDIHVIPNPIDTEVFKPGIKSDVRKSLRLPEDDFLLLAGSANIKEKRKGFTYLVEAMENMKERNPGIFKNIGLITFGKHSDVENLPVRVYPMAFLKNEKALVEIYQAADLFILPSLEDNLPNLVIESLACGTPVVAFNIGGMPEILDHKETGYLGKPKNVDDIIEGINWIRLHPDLDELKAKCRKKILDRYSPEIVLEKYLTLYKDLLN